ncbi:hypothetical protein FJZ26_00680 [Candidatus Parvarchaeota archaeon]|nr:hypothetical protein [Candidatus Parvarchaeota archaeon]
MQKSYAAKGHLLALCSFILLFALLLIALSGCTTPQPPPAQNASLQYFEIVLEKSACPNSGCFTEYLFTSSGQILKKQYDLPNYQGTPALEIRQAGEKATKEIFGKASSFATIGGGTPDKTSNKNKFFYFDGRQTHKFSDGDAVTSQFLEMFDAASQAFNSSSPSEDFFIHQYYQPIGLETKDFHFFSDGTVIVSIYGAESGRVESSSMFALEEPELSTLKQKAQAAVDSAFVIGGDCASSLKLVYGFIEIRKSGNYLDGYTCGEGYSGTDKLFKHIIEKYGSD